MREELCDASCGMLLDACKDVGEVRDRVHVVLLTRCDKRVEDGEILTRVLVADELRFPGRTDRSFRADLIARSGGI
jgi:hypothetical protein